MTEHQPNKSSRARRSRLPILLVSFLLIAMFAIRFWESSSEAVIDRSEIESSTTRIEDAEPDTAGRAQEFVDLLAREGTLVTADMLRVATLQHPLRRTEDIVIAWTEDIAPNSVSLRISEGASHIEERIDIQFDSTSTLEAQACLMMWTSAAETDGVHTALICAQEQMAGSRLISSRSAQWIPDTTGDRQSEVISFDIRSRGGNPEETGFWLQYVVPGTDGQLGDPQRGCHADRAHLEMVDDQLPLAGGVTIPADYCHFVSSVLEHATSTSAYGLRIEEPYTYSRPFWLSNAGSFGATEGFDTLPNWENSMVVGVDVCKLPTAILCI